MLKRTLSGIMLTLLLTIMLSSAFIIQPVEAAGGTVYIRADGSIDPPTANITSADNVTYYFTDDNYDEIVVERSSIVIDGNGYTLQGNGSGTGIDLSGRENVTVRNIQIKSFGYGIWLGSSNHNNIIGNNVTANMWFEIYLNSSSNNCMIGNNITASNGGGIALVYSSCNNIIGNNITATSYKGIGLLYSSNNSIIGNNITNNDYGITLADSSSNSIYHNNIIDNAHQVYDYSWDHPEILPSINAWDDGYPSGGNYWSDYADVDLYSGPYQNETGSDGIGDSPYVIDEDNADRYPLMHPWSPLPVHNINTGLGYATIQEAINANETINEHTIFVEAGTYYENVVVNKGVLLIGEDRETTIIDGSGTNFVVLVRNANNVIISGFTIQRSGYDRAGIYLFRSSNGTVNNNILKNNDWAGIRLQFSDNNTISGNKITDNYCSIACQWSNLIIIKNNNLINNEFGMDLFHSNSSTIIRNNITENGISILGGRNIVIENTIAYSDRGILFYGLESETCDNKIYHNNFISNVVQVETDDLASFWDNGYPSGGNYWSDYTGVDLHSGPYQNITGSDGIGDTPYVIDADNQDRYPLMHPWSSLPVHNINTGLGYATIQEAINAPETVDGHTIFVEAGIYHEHITTTKSLKLIGENSDDTIIDGDQIEAFLIVIKANNVTVSEFTLRNNGQTGVWLYNSSYTSICNNLIAGNKGHGIYMGDSLNNVILNNRIFNNSHTGIRFDWSSNCLIQMNKIMNNGVAGIVFMVGYTKSSVNNTIIENQIINNPTGVELSGCSDNSIYHNVFINNPRQVYSYNSLNIWNNSYPRGGNYWSDYSGVDVKSGLGQDLPGSDGIGDTAYVIDADNVDYYPLMNPYGAPPPQTYNLTITTTVGGTTDPAPGTYSYTANSTIQVTAIPEANYLFDHWELDSINVGSANPYTVIMDKDHTLKAVFELIPPPLSASISPLSASILVGQSVTFTSTVSGGVTPYSYQWYLNGVPVSGATSDTWTFTPTTSGIYYVYLKVTDDIGNTTQSETARITVTTVPVGGYSLPIKGYTTTKPLTLYLALIGILTASFTIVKRRKKQ